MVIGRPSRCASATAARELGAGVNAPYSSVPGPEPAILIRSTPSLTSSRISWTMSSTPRTSTPNADDSGAEPARQRVADALLRRDLSTGRRQARPVDQPGLDGVAHGDGDALRSAGIARRRHARRASTRAGVDRRHGSPGTPTGVWIDSSSSLRASPKLMCMWASTSPGMTVSPVASMARRAGVVGGDGVGRPDPGDAVAVDDDRSALDHACGRRTAAPAHRRSAASPRTLTAIAAGDEREVRAADRVAERPARPRRRCS